MEDRIENKEMSSAKESRVRMGEGRVVLTLKG